MPHTANSSSGATSTTPRRARTLKATSADSREDSNRKTMTTSKPEQLHREKAHTKMGVEIAVPAVVNSAMQDHEETLAKDMERIVKKVQEKALCSAQTKTPAGKTTASSASRHPEQIPGEEAAKPEAADKKQLKLKFLKAETELQALKAKSSLVPKANGVPVGPRAYMGKREQIAIQISVQNKMQHNKTEERIQVKARKRVRDQNWVWKTSPALGGHFSSIEPVFSKDEKYLFLAHECSVSVYSLKTSILVRSLAAGPSETPSDDRIIAYEVDPLSDEQLYSMTSAGKIYLFDWTEGLVVYAWNIKQEIEAMGICAEAKDCQGIVSWAYVVINKVDKGTTKTWELKRLELRRNEQTTQPGIGEEKLKSIKSFESPILALKVASGGALITIMTASTFWIGTKLSSGKEQIFDNWRHFTFSNRLTCMDFMVSDELGNTRVEKKQKISSVKGLLVAGDEKGKIYLWHDIFREGNNGQAIDSRRSLHWHRGAVEAVKLSKDGNYIISGGSETVLVLWQIDTGHKQFLPHLTSAIEHIVVSPSGTSYAIRLADNSVMVLSTTELKPKANIAGIQALPLVSSTKETTSQKEPKGIETINCPGLVSKLGPRTRRVVCCLHPTVEDTLLLVTPSYSARVSADSQFASCPYLQMYDTFTDRAISRQALTRTLATQVNIGPMGNTLTEPNVKLLAISGDGKWLASLDEWFSPISNCDDWFQGGGREVSLKFWRKTRIAEKSVWELVTTVDSPHPSPVTAGLNGGTEVFDIVPLPGKKLAGFATVGADGHVRIWKNRIRIRAGVSVRKQVKHSVSQMQGEELVDWGCKKLIRFAKGSAGPDNPVARFDKNDGCSNRSENSWGTMAISSDGSVIAVGAPTPPLTEIKHDSTLVYILDSLSSSIKQVLLGLQTGDISGLSFVNRYLIIAGITKLVVWDLVKGDVKWDLSIDELMNQEKSKLGSKEKAGRTGGANIIPLTRNDIFLASSSHTKVFTFALGVNRHFCQLTCSKSKIGSASSKIFVFTPNSPIPLHVTRLPLVECLTALKPVFPVADSFSDGEAVLTANVQGGGYLYLTSRSKIHYLTPLTAQHINVTSSSVIGEVGVKSPVALSHLYAPTTVVAEAMDVDAQAGEGRGDEKEEQEGEAIVPFELLAEIFESNGPSYATGGIGLEGLFDKVLGAFTGNNNQA